MGIGEPKKPGRSSATASVDANPTRRREPILEVWGSNKLRKSSSLLTSDTVVSTASGTAPARSRHRGTNRFHPGAIDAQLVGFELMALRQYRQTLVKTTIGPGSASDTKVAQNARTSGGSRFTGHNEFLKVTTSCRMSLARFSRTSICKTYCQHSGFFFRS